jgi:RHS repeat-associated protein
LTGSSGLAASRSYQYDLDGNRTRRVEGSVTTDYLYDRADQLAQQTISSVAKSFDYDRYGNLTSSWDGANAQTTYGYDEASRLTAINPPGGAAAAIGFTLDALDRPATRTLNGSTTDTYAYLDATETAYLTGQATTTGSLLDAAGTRLAVKTNGTVSWLVFDLHGSVAAMCPAGSTTLSDAYRYDGFGVQVASAGSVTNPYRYRGLLNLANDTGAGALLAMGAREYSPQLGTFTQEDSYAGSAANPASMNRFLYALANPATLVDPDGHRACLDEGTSCTFHNASTVDPYHCTSSICNPTGTVEGADVHVRDVKLTPWVRDNYRTEGDTWTITPEQAKDMILETRLAKCNSDARCIQAALDARHPLIAGFRDGLSSGAMFAGGLAAICILASGGLCALALAGAAALGTYGVVQTCADHGCGYGALHVGGNRPWTEYEIANVAGNMTGGFAIGGPTAGAASKGFGWIAERGLSGPSAGAAGGGTPLLAPGLVFEDHVLGQLATRGWTKSLVQSTVDNPTSRFPWRDTRWLQDGTKLFDPAIVYFGRRGGYVSVNQRTGSVVQVSDRLDPGWRAPWGD